MITMEKMIANASEGAGILADSILALMKRAYESGYDAGYTAGHNDRIGPATENELNIAFRDGAEEGYRKGLEDGYDEACMDLTDDDLCGTPGKECGMCFGASFGDCEECLGISTGACP